ncbi:hypothetical protein JW868_02610, partial [Candidatus Woesearchaeota archaeon]|nr:hypothetical protein [Candidatus Woesearchaeota archaeon]
MRKGFLGILLVATALLMVLAVSAAKAPKMCTTIQSGLLEASDGTIITTGFDEWGYNYEAHLFNGYYCDAYRDAAWCQDWAEDRLIMKWNDAWLSNKDCDGDSLLDRHYGFDSYIGSGAWLTNHQSGSYESSDTWIYTMFEKDPATWMVVEGGASGTLTYKSDDSFTFEAAGMTAGVEYALMYYPNPWPATGCMVLGTVTADEFGNVAMIGSFDFDSIPIAG